MRAKQGYSRPMMEMGNGYWKGASVQSRSSERTIGRLISYGAIRPEGGAYETRL